MSRFATRFILGTGLMAALIALAGCAGVRQLDTGTQAGAASAELFVPYQFQVQAIDGTVLRENFYTFDGRDQTLRLAPGEHELVLRYFDLIENNEDRTDDYARVLSEPITVSFTARANSQYAVTGDRPTTPSAGEAFAANPTLAIENRASGDTVSGDVAVAEPEIDTIRRGNTVFAPVGKTPSASSDAPQPAPENAPPQSLQMLKYWWNNASQAERDRFEAWRKQNGAQ
ncbi:DUF2057 family protein [Salinisphaera sp.]|uniref:DUF2057 family protein n=1 Tax=Salinisphaera sp. TaxID=1914330 RepID=UPI000C617FFF|nr:DUF2057 family protein [Salinisphaera sp.]MBS63565.1 hypothetical protein [Salinisphaera sp.]